jgi:putative tryptophan/tyrosine transport system substrate-binding protein
MVRCRAVRTRRRFLQGSLGLAGLGLLVGCGVRLPWAPRPARVPRIGYLVGGTVEVSRPTLEAFRRGLRELGYLEGRDCVVEVRFGEGRDDRLAEVTRELVSLPVEVIVVGGGLNGVRIARDLAGTTPVVMAQGGGDPVAEGLIASLARPGGSITGLISISVQLSAKRLELLKQTIPALARVGILWKAGIAQKALELREIERAAPTLGLQVHSLDVRAPGDVENAFRVAQQERVEALVTLQDSLTLLQLPRIVDLAATHRLPSMYEFEEWTEAGGLMSYGPDRVDLNRRAAGYVDKILKGAKPADLPVEQPTTFELAINLKTAQALGLVIPQSVLLQATKLIE